MIPIRFYWIDFISSIVGFLEEFVIREEEIILAARLSFEIEML